ncbi:hypothetical protein DAPPUDRAFT_238207 [Daphnia pulex]|uniref:Uncharacterized protein n=1 Tax=Daphnia pulex TaxID=6669 RepID=E9G5S7_DAPPU|nr:hypothetical protein DAPPUDRAFT_238207 [Daphnia pulex]|eukprot:EFX85119.1 hypothetical protein DAPPUDRAFT_238207 [Daphnia pulex]
MSQNPIETQFVVSAVTQLGFYRRPTLVAKLKTAQKRVNKAVDCFTRATGAASSSALRGFPLRISTDT